MWLLSVVFFFFQAEDGIRDLVRSRGLGDVYKRQHLHSDGGILDNVPTAVMRSRSAGPVIAVDVCSQLSLIHI